MTLYELTGDLMRLYAMLEIGSEDEWYDPDFVEAQFNETADAIVDKAEGYAKIIRNLTAQAEGFKAEKMRLAKKQQIAENAVSRLKTTLQNAMEQIGADKITTGIGKWSIQNNPPSVMVTDISKVPERFLIPQDPKVDNAAVKAEFKVTGEIFDGLEILQGRSLRFR